MANKVKTRVLEILRDQDPITNVFKLLTELGESKDADIVKDVALRVLETNHDWDSIRECLKLWQMLPWANEFLQRMYKRVEEDSKSPPFTDMVKLDRQLDRVSNIYWRNKSPKKESKSVTNEALRDYLSRVKHQNTMKSLPPLSSTAQLNLPQLPQQPKQENISCSKFTRPKNPDFAIEQQLRRNAFAEGGFKEIAEPAVASNYAWKLPDLPKLENNAKQEQPYPSEIKPTFDNGRASTSKFTAFRNFKEEFTPNKDVTEHELSFAFSPINKVLDVRKVNQTRPNRPATFQSKMEEDFSNDGLQSMTRPTAPRRMTFATDVNQLYPHETMLALSRNGYYRNNRNKLSVLDELRQHINVNILGDIIRDMETLIK